MSPHNPATPDQRRRLALDALRTGTALHLPDALALQAEQDARYLAHLHGGTLAALWATVPAKGIHVNIPDETTTETHGRAFWRRLLTTSLGFRVRVLRGQPGDLARRQADALLTHLFEHDGDLRRLHAAWMAASRIERGEAIPVALVPAARGSGVRLAKGQDASNARAIRDQLDAVRAVGGAR